MSTKQGNTRPTAAKRVIKPGQKHQNTHAWKTDKYHSDGLIAVIKNVKIVYCCPRCTDIIQWKVKYGKYKPLSAPSKCVECLQKAVKHAYHIRCGPCVTKSGRCAKCGELNSDWVNVSGPSQEEIDRKEADFQADIKTLPERRRRAFYRYIAKLEKESNDQGSEEAATKLAEMKAQYGKESGGFDLEDLDDDFDDLDLDEPDF